MATRRVVLLILGVLSVGFVFAQPCSANIGSLNMVELTGIYLFKFRKNRRTDTL
ncbi:MAG: hypothetical protein ACW98Y_14665 [Candidatus Thorarchaeota archaeon]